ncbi:MAG: HAMP domain-containing histidine kinase [Muribaculaceae bacterium]|nr:HAMP domain-containing histidine kinase [Muribaculaceae bacterium]
MALKKRLSYQWRIFFPLVALLWTLIIVLVFFQYKREVAYRSENINRQLAFINNRIINAYERDLDLVPFMHFVAQYFDNTIFNDIIVSVYDDSGKLIYCIGTPILQSDSDNIQSPELIEAEQHGVGTSLRTGIVYPDSLFYFSARKSTDGKIFVHTAMPYNLSIADAISAESSLWIIVITIAVIVTIIAYYASRYFSRNITLLRDFANRAALGKDFIAEGRFPHDELGDISRQIINIYREKDKAIEQREREHRIAIHATEEKSRIKRQLTNNINHELKTPIGIIKGYLDTIASDPGMDNDTRQRFITKSQEHMQRLCNLLNDISTMTRLDEAGSNIPTTEIDYHDLVYSISNDLEVSKINGPLEFNFDLPFECNINGNYSLLTDMLLNLIKNAAAYSHGTETWLKLINESENYYTFTFYDNGIGVEEQHIPHLFERFYRIDEGRSRKAGGTGLGLPIVRNTILMLGGTISVKNRHGGGLEFLYTLPKWKSRT